MSCLTPPPKLRFIEPMVDIVDLPQTDEIVAGFNCIDYTLHPKPHTPPSRDVFNPSENCYSSGFQLH